MERQHLPRPAKPLSRRPKTSAEEGRLAHVVASLPRLCHLTVSIVPPRSELPPGRSSRACLGRDAAGCPATSEAASTELPAPSGTNASASASPGRRRRGYEQANQLR